MNNVADTSKQSYKKLDKVKEMSQCDRIHEALRRSDKALTVNELNKTALADLDIPNGRVSARINKLKSQGKVLESDKREDIFTGRKVKTWTDLVDSVNKESGSVVNSSSQEDEDEFVTMEEADSSDSEEVDGLFKNDKQSDSSDVLMEDGEVKI